MPRFVDNRGWIVVLGQRYRYEEVGQKPVPADMPGVKGVFVGGCIETGIGRIDPKERHAAHAHIAEPYEGWVCFQFPEGLGNEALRMHELAHIETRQGHTDAWRRAMIRLGQVIPERYEKRTRKRIVS